MNRIAKSDKRDRLAAILMMVALGVALVCTPNRMHASTSEGSSGADSATAESADIGLEVAEVVVTARRTEEKLRDVPVAVTAVCAEALPDQRIDS